MLILIPNIFILCCIPITYKTRETLILDSFQNSIFCHPVFLRNQINYIPLCCSIPNLNGTDMRFGTDSPGGNTKGVNLLKCIDGLVQDCRNSRMLAMELLQSCSNPSIQHMHCIGEMLFLASNLVYHFNGVVNVYHIKQIFQSLFCLHLLCLRYV